MWPQRGASVLRELRCNSSSAHTHKTRFSSLFTPLLSFFSHRPCADRRGSWFLVLRRRPLEPIFHHPNVCTRDTQLWAPLPSPLVAHWTGFDCDSPRRASRSQPRATLSECVSLFGFCPRHDARTVDARGLRTGPHDCTCLVLPIWHNVFSESSWAPRS